MTLLDNLINSKFLSNIKTELQQARKILLESDVLLYQESTHYTSKEVARQLYYDVCESYGFFDLIYLIDKSSKVVHYAHSDQFIFAATRSKPQLKQTIEYSLAVNGDIPVYTSKHTVQGKAIYTVLFDTTFTITPPSPN